MNILLTNDDGIFAPGLRAIYKKLIKLGDVTVAAPASSQSGASHSITFSEPLVCNRVDINGLFTGYSIQGSPADCVKLAVMELCEKPIDLLIAGINNGANVGINIYYSGTVAAAMEGAFLKIPSIALSTVYEEQTHFDLAADHCIDVIEKLIPLESGHVVNVNVPRLSKGKPRGIKVAPQSTEAFKEHYIKQQNEEGQTVYQLAAKPQEPDGSQSDIISVMEGYIAVTALSPGMTDTLRTEKLKEIKW